MPALHEGKNAALHVGKMPALQHFKVFGKND